MCYASRVVCRCIITVLVCTGVTGVIEAHIQTKHINHTESFVFVVLCYIGYGNKGMTTQHSKSQRSTAQHTAQQSKTLLTVQLLQPPDDWQYLRASIGCANTKYTTRKTKEETN